MTVTLEKMYYFSKKGYSVVTLNCYCKRAEYYLSSDTLFQIPNHLLYFKKQIQQLLLNTIKPLEEQKSCLFTSKV